MPGTVVHGLNVSDKGIEFKVEAKEDAQITLELEAEKEYKVYIDGTNVGKMETNLGGKLNLSVELNPGQVSKIKIEKQ